MTPLAPSNSLSLGARSSADPPDGVSPPDAAIVASRASGNPGGETRERPRSLEPHLAAPLAAPTPIVARNFGDIHFLVPSPSGGEIVPEESDLSFAESLSAINEAEAFFQRIEVVRDPGDFDSIVVSAPELNAAALAEAFRHYQTLFGTYNLASVISTRPGDAYLDRLRGLARAVLMETPTHPDFHSRLDDYRLLAPILSEIDHRGFGMGDRDRLRGVLEAWLHEIQAYPLADARRIEDLSALAELAHEHELDNFLHGPVADAIQTHVSEWRNGPDDNPRARVSRLQLAFTLLHQTQEFLEDPLRALYEDTANDLDGAARELECSAASGPLEARLAARGEAAAAYRLLMNHPENGTFYRDRFLEILTRIETECAPASRARDTALAPETRLQILLQVVEEFESLGMSERASGIREGLLRDAGRALRRGGRGRLEVLSRYDSLREAFLIYRQLGSAEEQERARNAVRALMEGVLSQVEGQDDPEVARQILAFAVEAYLAIGDFTAAEILIERIHDGLPEIPTQDTGEVSAMTVDEKSQWLLRLAGYVQQLASLRSDEFGVEADFSGLPTYFQELAGLGARHGHRTLALYGRFMRAVIDQDPAAESLYEELRDWRPTEGRGGPMWPPVRGIMPTSAGGHVGPPLHVDFFAEPPPEYQPDRFQEMAGRIWESHRVFHAASRSAPTIQFLSLLIEGNYEQRLAEADDENEGTEGILEERDRVRNYLGQIQSLIVSGRASTTSEAISMLPEVVGDENAVLYFYRYLGRAFEYLTFRGQVRNFYDNILGTELTAESDRLGRSDLVRRLIQLEEIEDPNRRAAQMVSLAREMVVEDSLNHRCDALIGTLLQFAEDSGAEGYRPRSLDEILQDFAPSGEDITVDHWSELYNRIAGNETLREQIEAARDVTPYIQCANQVVDSVFSVEGGVILIASIFTAGVAAELAGAALLARMGTTAYVVVNGAARLTWTARIALGATRISAAWLARSATELGGIGLYRLATGRRQMQAEEIRLRLITSLFCSVGDEFATHITRAVLSQALRPVLGTGSRAIARTHAISETAEFFTAGLGEMWGEEMGARVAGGPADTRPFLLRYFEETLHGSFFVLGTRAGRPLAERMHESPRPTLFAGTDGNPGSFRLGIDSRWALGMGLMIAIDPDLAHASFGATASHLGPLEFWTGFGLSAAAILGVYHSRRRGSRPGSADQTRLDLSPEASGEVDRWTSYLRQLESDGMPPAHLEVLSRLALYGAQDTRELSTRINGHLSEISPSLRALAELGLVEEAGPNLRYRITALGRVLNRIFDNLFFRTPPTPERRRILDAIAANGPISYRQLRETVPDVSEDRLRSELSALRRLGMTSRTEENRIILSEHGRLVFRQITSIPGSMARLRDAADDAEGVPVSMAAPDGTRRAGMLVPGIVRSSAAIPLQYFSISGTSRSPSREALTLSSLEYADTRVEVELTAEGSRDLRMGQVVTFIPALEGGRGPEGSPSEESTLPSEEIRELAASDHVSPDALLNLLSQDPDFSETYSRDVGVREGYSLREHTRMVLNQFERYFADRPLPGGVDPGFFRTLLALHDIGKPRAVAEGDSSLQHGYTREIIEEVLPRLGFSPEETRLAGVLVSADPLGAYFQAEMDVDVAAIRIHDMAVEAGWETAEFFQLLTSFYQCDAASYSRDAGGRASPVERVFVFDPEARRLGFTDGYQASWDYLRSTVDAVASLAAEAHEPGVEESAPRLPLAERIAALGELSWRQALRRAFHFGIPVRDGRDGDTIAVYGAPVVRNPEPMPDFVQSAFTALDRAFQSYRSGSGLRRRLRLLEDIYMMAPQENRSRIERRLRQLWDEVYHTPEGSSSSVYPHYRTLLNQLIARYGTRLGDFAIRLDTNPEYGTGPRMAIPGAYTHYTDLPGLRGLLASGRLRLHAPVEGRQPRVYLTHQNYSPLEAWQRIFIGNPLYRSRGRYVIGFDLAPHVFVRSTGQRVGTGSDGQPIYESWTTESLEIGRDIFLRYAGENPLLDDF